MQTEILATLSPASVAHLPQMAAAGLTGVRINSSHGDPDSHLQIILAAREHLPSGMIVYDIKGPKIRIGDLPEPLRLIAGQELVLRTDLPHPENSEYPLIHSFDEGIPITYPDLDRTIRPGHRLFIDDGTIGLQVKHVEEGKIICQVLYGDLLRSRKGLNHPDTVVDYPYTMPADQPYIDFAMQHGVDFIADSFTRNGADVRELRHHLQGSGIGIISKIENPEGLAHFDEILAETDAVMIARGDLGVEIDPWELPEHQKVMIEKCNRACKPVITATQMLESMIDNPHPSRADVSDVANALYDGSDIVMLSGETSIGSYPVECVRMMRRICSFVELTARYRNKKAQVNGLRSLLKKK
ncbi:MAG TPA: pyruvate kinase [bacterium]|nr:pyruvate kinase [bacterium]HOX85096.1 pyruvate kinase [bacterium]HPG44039.1 pyruvate kinase [bacterium]HPM96406.1 pyruvate kinase [bacterium]